MHERNANCQESRGLNLAFWAIVILSFVGIISVGIITGTPMIGDEVTHYYMLVKQADNLSAPNFKAEIPTGYESSNVRQYPHVFAWHYFGAVIYRYLGQSLNSVQFYHSLFFLQLMISGFMLSRSRGGMDDKSAIVYLLSLASIPMVVLFSVAFYQDVPVAAQLLTAFYLLSVRRSLLSMIFIILAVMIKETAILLVPAYLFLMVKWDLRFKSKQRAIINLFVFLVLIAMVTACMQNVMRVHTDNDYYPIATIKKYLSKFIPNKSSSSNAVPVPAGQVPDVAVMNPLQVQASMSEVAQSVPAEIDKQNVRSVQDVTPYEAEIIANHPGDLRLAKNYFIYGGILMWLIAIAGVFGLVFSRGSKESSDLKRHTAWLWLVGISYIVVCAFMIRSAPDARFFLPALPFILLPLAEGVVRLGNRRAVITVIAAIAIIQYGAVLMKTFKLRNVSGALVQGIEYLREHKPAYSRIFMYPEGNYRLFPCSHEWYLSNRLREFWKGDNDTRLRMLNAHNIGAIVVKKHLISEVDDKITNLGVYPLYFVHDLQKDSRFNLVFDNNAVSIYTFPLDKKN